MGEWYLYEFLYRGRHESEPMPEAWAVTIRNTVTNETRQMSMERAQEEGWPLPDILSMLSDSTMRQAEQLSAQLAKTQENLEAEQERSSRLQRDLTVAQQSVLAADARVVDMVGILEASSVVSNP